jgi:hypothetical protein
MEGVVLGLAGAALVASTGLAVAAIIGIRSLSELLLGAYVLAFAEIIGLTLALSALGAMSRWGFVIGIVALFLASVTGWLAAGRPRSSRISTEVRSLVGDPPLSVLATAVGLALAYLAALIVATAPNSWDSLSYHLSRAAFWSQSGHVGYIPNAYDVRMDGSPPNAELVLTSVFDVTRSERLVGFVQFVAALACSMGVYALARRLSFPVREAAFGALLFLTLPVVLLQAPTTQNDLVAASGLTAAAVFLTGTSTAAMALAVLATALAVGTKLPAVYGLPLLLVLALTAPDPKRRIARLLALGAGTAVGAYWYVVNLRAGSVFGPTADASGGLDGGYFRPPREAVLTAFGFVVDSFDLSGSRGSDVLLYLVAAVVVAIAMAAFAGRGSSHRVRYALLAGALALLPLALYPGSYVVWKTFAKVHQLLSGATWFGVRAWDPTRTGENYSWFGPLGLFLAVGVGIAAVVLVYRRNLTARALLYAAAPLVWLVLLAATIVYEPWDGRFFIFPVGLSAALWGMCMRVRPVAWAVVTVAVATTILALVNNASKPSGLRLIEPNPPASVWTMDRWEVQSIQRPGVPSLLRFVEQRIPASSRIALALDQLDFGYPPFGPTLARRVELAAQGSDGRDVLDADWIVATSAGRALIDRTCWRAAFDDGERAVFRRRPGTCVG